MRVFCGCAHFILKLVRVMFFHFPVVTTLRWSCAVLFRIKKKHKSCVLTQTVIICEVLKFSHLKWYTWCRINSTLAKAPQQARVDLITCCMVTKGVRAWSLPWHVKRGGVIRAQVGKVKFRSMGTTTTVALSRHRGHFGWGLRYCYREQSCFDNWSQVLFYVPLPALCHAL